MRSPKRALQWGIRAGATALLLVLSVETGVAADPGGKNRRDRRIARAEQRMARRQLEKRDPSRVVAPLRLEGVAFSAGSSEIILERTAPPEMLDKLLRSGFREVKRAADIGQATIMGDKYYTLFDVDPEAGDAHLFEVLSGKDVVLELKQDERGRLTIVSANTKRR